MHTGHQIKRDIERNMCEEQQKERDHVCRGEREVKNNWRSKYLGLIFQADDSHAYITDVKSRISKVITHTGKLHNMWSTSILSLTLKLRLRLYKSLHPVQSVITLCYFILVYRSETWTLDVET